MFLQVSRFEALLYLCQHVSIQVTFNGDGVNLINLRLSIIIHIFLLLFTDSSCLIANAEESFSEEDISYILEKIGSDISPKFISLLKGRKVRKLPNVLALNTTQPITLSMERYKHFLEPYALNIAKKFYKKWYSTFLLAEREFGVDSFAIASILLVETSFGRYTGTYNPISVFASIVANARHELTNPKGEHNERILKKQKWAVEELKSLSIMSIRYASIDLLQLQGSFSGAFGICQFLPSSYINFAASKSRHTPNLFSHEDAIWSVGSYLKANGYSKHWTSEESYAAIFHYNNSDVYVKTVQQVASKLYFLIHPSEKSLVK